MNYRAIRFVLLAGLVTLFHATSSQAQSSNATHAASADAAAVEADALGDIVVTARRKSESLQKIPVAVTALSVEQTGTMGVFRPTMLGEQVPGMRATSLGADRENVVFNIRGQGFEFMTLFPAVIPYFGEVPLQSLTSANFYDLQSLEVLRGPQGVRFGRVTNGGAILLQPKRPGWDIGGFGQVKAGNYGMLGVNAGLTLPIVDDVLTVRAAMSIEKRGGYTENLVNGANLDNIDNQSYRFSAVFRPTSWMENYTVYQYSTAKSNGSSISISNYRPDGILLPTLRRFFGAEANDILARFLATLDRQKARGPRTVENGDLAFGPDAGLRARRTSHLVVNTTELDLNDTLKLKNVFGYVRYKQNTGTDADGTAISIINIPGRFVPEKNGRQVSNELQLSGSFFDNVLNTSIGGYADSQKPVGRQERDIVQFLILQSAQVLFTKTTSRAIYGNAEVDLSKWVEGFKLNGGLRYTKDTVRARSLNFSGLLDPSRPKGICVDYLAFKCNNLRSNFNALTFEGGASYSVGRTFLYAAYRKGYRPGGVSAVLDPALDSYQPEYNQELEIGVKSSFNLGSVPFRVNMAAFTDDYTKIQRGTNVIIGGVAQTVVTNIADARIKGLEYELQILPFDGLSVSASGAYTDAKYKRGTQDLFGPTGACNRDASRNLGFCTLNRLIHTPKTSINVAARYTLPVDRSVGVITLGGDWYHQSSMSLNNGSYLNPLQIQKAYSKLNLSVDWSEIAGSNFDLSVFANNVTNTLYRESDTPLSMKSSLGFDADTYSEPRMVGASIRYRFGADAS